MLDLKPYRESLTELCKSLSVRELDIFGSAVREDFGPDSDIDVLVAFAGTDDLFLRFMGLKARLEALFERRVDLVMADAIRNPYMQRAVMDERVPVYAA